MPKGRKRKATSPPEGESESKKFKLDIYPSEKEENQLPDELVLKIFHSLKREELLHSSSTCRQWYRISLEPEFAWTEFESCFLAEDPNYYRYLSDRSGGAFKSLDATEKKEELERWHADPVHSNPVATIKKIHDKSLYYSGRNSWHLLDKEGNLVAVTREKSSIPLTCFKSAPNVWKYTLTEIASDQPDAKGYETNLGQRTWHMKIFINLREFDELALNSQKIPNQAAVIAKVANEWYRQTVGFTAAKLDYVSRPMKSNTAQKQPEGFKNGINLFKYQLDAVTWMKTIEDQIGQEITYCMALRWKGSKVYFDFNNNQLVLPPFVKNFICREKINGGILGDEVGLGKTFEVLGLILSSPPNPVLDPHPTLIESKSTLVLCPNHLSKQWHDEITRATDLKVYVINTIVQLRALTYEQIRSEFDIILCVYQLFETPHYCLLPKTGNNTKKFDAAKDIDWDQRNNAVDSALKAIKKSKKYPATCPILDHFYWHRVVVDEGHDVIGVNPHGDFIARIHGRSKWYVTATPFAHHTCLDGIKEFIGFDMNGFRGQPAFQKEILIKDYFWRNTKESVKDELTIPDTVDELKFVEFSNIERALYMTLYSRGDYAQVEFCAFTRDRNDLKSKMLTKIEQLKSNIPELVANVRTLENELEGRRITLRAMGPTVPEPDRKALTRELTRKEDALAHERTALNVARNVLEILEVERDVYDARMNDKTLTPEKREYLQLQERHGTKLTEMILYLKNLLRERPESRVIMFSQFDATLTETAAILKEHNIKTTSVAGNVYKKTKAIEEFKSADEDVKVIMLSLAKTAAGTNLIAATHIVLLDPVSGNKEAAQAIEMQAIGRAHRQGQTKQIIIVRFIVRNSIDHRIYLRNNNLPKEGSIKFDPETYKPSITTVTARAAKLSKTGSFSSPTMSEMRKSLEIPNNTNVMPNDEKQTKTTKTKKTAKKEALKAKKNNNNDVTDDDKNEG